jgi:hypothetical protein
MEILQEIGLQVIEILTLVFGILGMTFSIMLLLSPNRTKNLSHVLNRSINFNQKLEFVDKSIEVTAYLYKYHIIIGLVLVGGSAFSLFFFFFSLDIAQLSKLFLDSGQYRSLVEIGIFSMSWIGKFVCMVGLAAGSLLVFAPGAMQRLETKLNYWFETKTALEKLDRSGGELDAFFFRHPVLMGVIGGALSFFIVSLSIINLLN